jgi:hypothetical protein
VGSRRRHLPREIGERIGIEWSAGEVDPEQFRMGLAVELEHGSQDPATDVTHDDETVTGKIALAHLREISDYYTRLAAMERDGKGSSARSHAEAGCRRSDPERE